MNNKAKKTEASEFQITIGVKDHTAYFPKRFSERFGTKLNVLPVASAVVMYNPDTALQDVIASLEIAVQILKLQSKSVV